MAKVADASTAPRVSESDSTSSSITDSTVEANVELPKRRTPREWFTKYFLEGQKMDESHIESLANLPADLSIEQKILVKYRKYVALVLPFVVAQFFWWCTALRWGFLSLYPTHWQMPVTMILGATIGGMTSEGGGAVAFPVMTFILHLDPTVARDFSLMIQTIGMGAALFVIVFMRIQIEWRAILFGLMGSIPGAILGFHVLDPLFAPPEKKMMFVSIWTSFAFALWLLNRDKKRKTVPVIQAFCWWKALVLLTTGFVGGVFTSFAGSGVDIATFSMVTLLFSVSEKTATPTTVVLMALLTQFCFYWRAVMMADIDQLAWDYLKVSVPVVVMFAPLGSFLGSHFHRQVMAHAVYILEIAALVGFLFTMPQWHLLAACACIIGSGFFFFSNISKLGKKLLAKDTAEVKEQPELKF
ncbi:Protein C15A11.4 [Aphelenchoides avenae]|nr:Protein C15A11.4 [Aphelenchus avenae]